MPFTFGIDQLLFVRKKFLLDLSEKKVFSSNATHKFLLLLFAKKYKDTKLFCIVHFYAFVDLILNRPQLFLLQW